MPSSTDRVAADHGLRRHLAAEDPLAVVPAC